MKLDCDGTWATCVSFMLNSAAHELLVAAQCTCRSYLIPTYTLNKLFDRMI